jgi:hypothetical protein
MTAAARPIAALRAFARTRPEVEHCDLCGREVPTAHDHLVDPGGQLRCACRACGLLFDPAAQAGWRRVEPRVTAITPPGDRVWAMLDVPVGIAFVVRTPVGLVIRYPSPAGLAQGAPSAAAWDALGAEVTAVRELALEVEAVLIDRRRALAQAGGAAYLVSIDECYRLAGLLRRREDVEAWFADLAMRGAARHA